MLKWSLFFQVPTLIIYGEKDTGLGHASRDDLSNIPTSQAVELPEARHPAYLDQPDMFHTLLYNFIKQVHAHRAIVQSSETICKMVDIILVCIYAFCVIHHQILPFDKHCGFRECFIPCLTLGCLHQLQSDQILT